MQDGTERNTPWILKKSMDLFDWNCAASPDLNPIKNVWRVMKDKLDDLPIRPTTIPEMIQVLENMWNNLNPQVDTLPYITSLPARIKAVIAANGGHTKY